jgi:hypothetical protein
MECFTETLVGKEKVQKCDVSGCRHKGFADTTSRGNLRAF